ncbi:MAG TPA: hypothetical protein VGT04_16305 [Acidobacteriaceae bacterium]|nr:hypothetical protein [Acidobacteriaceae bacterium]
MKLFVRASILSVAVASLVAGFAPHRNATAQNVALSHQVVSGIMPAVPHCGSPQQCGFGPISH